MFLISLISYAQETKQNDIDNMTKEQVLGMTLDEMSSLSLEELMKLVEIAGVSSLDELYQLLNKNVTSASKRTESQFETPLSSTVVSNQELIASGATTIEEAMRLVPGVIVREKTNGNYDVHIRGNDNLPAGNMMVYSENTKTLVMINGRPVFNYAFGGILWESLPVTFEDIDRIEVVRGPASALYGPNAVTGAINIITKKIQEGDISVSATAQGGNMGSYLGDFALRNKMSSKIGVGLSGNYETRDRINDDIYLFNNGFINGMPAGKDYYSLSEYESMYVDPYNVYPIKDPKDNINDLFPTIGLAKQRYALNGYLSIWPSRKVSVDISGGYQDSKVVSSTLGDTPTSFSTRLSSTGYVNLQSGIEKFQFLANYSFGDQDFACGDEGFRVDMKQLNVSGEYDLQFKSLNIRPGISYQNVSYNDSPYLKNNESGYFNGERSLSTIAASMRFDYTLFDKLRLVAALRGEKYNKPDDLYGSWQFAATLPFNDKHLVRVVYSRANQSALMLNTETDYLWDRTGRTPPDSVRFFGNDNYDLMTMDMVEIGYRVKPVKSIVFDIEAYFNQSKNFGALMPDITYIKLNDGLNPLLTDPVLPYYVALSYHNFDLKAKQVGISARFDWVVSKNIFINGHFNYQLTKLDDYLGVSRDSVIVYQAATAAYELMTSSTPTFRSSAWPSEMKSNVEHKSTPSYYGMLGIRYRPIKKLELMTNCYFYGEQEYVNQYGTFEVDSKLLLNLKVNYHVFDFMDLFVNGRNILNSTTKEFAAMDDIGALYMGGLRINY